MKVLAIDQVIVPAYNAAVAISGIYAIENTETGRCYIGSSVDVQRRIAAHRTALRRGDHDNPHLQRAWMKHGEAVFRFILVERCESLGLLLREQAHLHARQDTYNVCEIAGAPPSRKGQRNSVEHRRKVADANIGLKRGPHAPETRERIRASNVGQKRSPEFCAHMSATLKGRKASSEHRTNISKALVGRRLSESHRAKLSAARRRTVAAKKRMR